MLGAALLGAGKAGRSGGRADRGGGPDGDDPISLAWLAHAKALAGARDEAGAIVGQARIERAQASYVPGYHLALAHIGLGNRDAAFELLENACADREPAVVNLRVEPRFDHCAATRATAPAAAAPTCPSRWSRRRSRLLCNTAALKFPSESL